MTNPSPPRTTGPGKKQKKQTMHPDLFPTDSDSTGPGTSPPLEALQLENFGKFRERTFPLGAVTLFYGSNEAGKTTLFDSLFYALCRPGANKKAGKELRARYGDSLQARALYSSRTPSDFSLNEEEFLNLLSIRAGDITIQMDSRSRWLDRVKARLFTGGLDPALVVAGLEKRSSGNRTLSHNKQREEWLRERDSLQSSLESLLHEKESLLTREESAEEQRVRLEETNQEASRLRKELERAEQELALQEKIRLRKQLLAALASLRELRNRQQELERLAPFAENRLPELDRILASVQESDQKRLSLEASLRLHEKERTDLEQEREKGAAEEHSLRHLAHRARLFLDRLEQREKDPFWKRETRWRPAYLMGAALLFLSGMAGALLVADPLLKTLLFALGGAAALLTGFFARETKMVRDEAAVEAFARELRGEWNATEEEKLPDGATLSTIRTLLQRHENRLETHHNRQRELEESLQRSLHRVREEREELRKREEALAEQHSRVKAWLQGMGVRDRDAYLLKRSEYEEMRTRLDSLRDRFQRDFHGKSPEELEPEWERRLKILDEEAVPEAGLDERDLSALRRKRDAHLAEIRRLEERARSLIASSERQSGEIRGTLDKLTEEIRSHEERLLRLAHRIHEEEINQKGAKLALELFREIQEDAGVLMTELSEDLSVSFGQFLPELRKIRVDGLDLKQVRVEDAGGALRPVEHLSHGTRDTFLFATRLALAKRSHEGGPSLLILDEPFLTLDREREMRALEMLREFQRETGWQLILLTKDEILKERVESLFSGAVIHAMGEEPSP